MHQYIVNASLQIIPVVQDRHPYLWVDEAISIIEDSGISYDVGPFATIIEGNYEQVMKVINDVNEYLLSKGCVEWISNIQIQITSNGDITGDEKGEFFTFFLMLNGKPLNYNEFGPDLKGELTVVKGAPVTGDSTEVPFQVYLRRDGNRVLIPGLA